MKEKYTIQNGFIQIPILIGILIFSAVATIGAIEVVKHKEEIKSAVASISKFIPSKIIKIGEVTKERPEKNEVVEDVPKSNQESEEPKIKDQGLISQEIEKLKKEAEIEISKGETQKQKEVEGLSKQQEIEKQKQIEYSMQKEKQDEIERQKKLKEAQQSEKEYIEKKRIDAMREGLKNVVTYYKNFAEKHIKESTIIVIKYYNNLISLNEGEKVTLKSFHNELKRFAFLGSTDPIDELFNLYFKFLDAEKNLFVAENNKWRIVEGKILKDVNEKASNLIDYINLISDAKLNTDYDSIAKDIGNLFGSIPSTYLNLIKEDTDEYIKNDLPKRQEMSNGVYNVVNLWIENAKSRISQLRETYRYSSGSSGISEFQFKQFLMTIDNINFQLGSLNQGFNNLIREISSFRISPF